MIGLSVVLTALCNCDVTKKLTSFLLVLLQHKLAKLKVQYGFSLASLSDCGGSDDIDKKQALEMGEKSVNEALEILHEVK